MKITKNKILIFSFVKEPLIKTIASSETRALIQSNLDNLENGNLDDTHFNSVQIFFIEEAKMKNVS